MSERRWLLVIAPDTTVIATGMDAPASFVGAKLGAVTGLAEEVRKTGCALASSLRPDRPTANAELTIPGSPPTRVLLVAIAAVGIAPHSCRLPALIDRVIASFRWQAEERDIELKAFVQEGLGESLLDAEKIGWVISMLVGNAFRYVRSGTRRLPGGTIRISAERLPPHLVITIADDGPGIPADKVRWLFERDPDADAPVGLGLKVAHDIVVAHGGTMHIETSTDFDKHGTSVEVRLPDNKP